MTNYMVTISDIQSRLHTIIPGLCSTAWGREIAGCNHVLKYLHYLLSLVLAGRKDIHAKSFRATGAHKPKVPIVERSATRNERQRNQIRMAGASRIE